MGTEIERKYLIIDDSWKTKASEGIEIKQGYLNSEAKRTVRIRISGEQGWLTIKGKNENLTRKEFEYDIPLTDALELLNLCEKPIIEKTRYIFLDNGNSWEIDVFSGENEGLVIAEIELSREDQEFTIPEWVGEEVSMDVRYYNSSLISNPFVNWEK